MHLFQPQKCVHIYTCFRACICCVFPSAYFSISPALMTPQSSLTHSNLIPGRNPGNILPSFSGAAALVHVGFTLRVPGNLQMHKGLPLGFPCLSQVLQREPLVIKNIHGNIFLKSIPMIATLTYTVGEGLEVDSSTR